LNVLNELIRAFQAGKVTTHEMLSPHDDIGSLCSPVSRTLSRRQLHQRSKSGRGKDLRDIALLRTRSLLLGLAHKFRSFPLLALTLPRMILGRTSGQASHLESNASW
jgi:hypothetical protein